MYACPNCKNPNELEVAIEAWAYLVQEDEDNFETRTDEALDGSHEWDDASRMKCTACGMSGLVEDFRKES